MSRTDEARALLEWATSCGTRVCHLCGRSIDVDGHTKDCNADALLAIVEDLERHNGHLQGVIDGDVNVLGLKDGALMVEHPLFALMGSIYARILDEHAAENYVETRMLHKDTAAEYIVTVRRHDGRTPHELRMGAERERDEARRQLAEATEALAAERAPLVEPFTLDPNIIPPAPTDTEAAP